MSFVNLHNHTDASLLDGLSKVQQIVDKAKEYDHPAVAITDHGNIFNAIHFYKACRKANIKPIMGIEVYFTPDAKKAKEDQDRSNFHLVLLAENEEGWRNIVRLTTLSNTPEMFYGKPRIDYKALAQHSEGVIALTACMHGIVPHYLLKEERREAYDHATKLYDIFGERLYFETQNAGLKDQYKLNQEIREIAKRIGRPVVATVDSHYIDPEDALTHLELLTLSTNNREFVMNSGFASSCEFYFKDRKDVKLPEEELDNTLEVAERCNVTIDLTKHRFPKYPLTEGNSEQLLRKKLRDGWHSRLSKEKKKNLVYQERGKREINDIIEGGFADYFLIISDMVTWAKNEGIWIGPGRGSVAGSLLSYLLNITDIDPIENGLIFERFYNKGRAQAAPDIDTDIELRYRKRVIDYIAERFGQDRVAQLMTLNTMAARASLKDIMRINNIPFDEANEITKYVPAKSEEHGSISLKEALERSPELKKFKEDKRYTQCFQYAEKIEGVAKSIGTHAAAVVILDESFDNGTVPLVRSPDGHGLVCGFDMTSIDDLNILKCDALGLATLEMMHRCHDLLKERRDIEIYPKDIPLNDKKTFDLIATGNVDGGFQIESFLGKKWCKLLMPKNIDDISDLISLIRPGSLDAGMLDAYYKVRMGEQEATYIHNSLEPILRSTNGKLCYQEQVMEICNKIAKMTLSESDKLRKAIAKKKPEELKKWKNQFIRMVVDNNNDISQEVAETIWSWIEPHAGYSFCRSHGLAYAINAYHTMYYKAHYPVEFFCACLMCANYCQKPLEEIRRFVNDAKLFNIKILPPDIRIKNLDFFVTDDHTIRFGLSNIKNLGESAIEKLQNIDFESEDFYSFLFNINLNKQVVIALISSGALDHFELSRDRMLNEFELYRGLTIKQRDIVKELFCIKSKYKNVADVIREIADENNVDYWKEEGLRPPNVSARKKLRLSIADYEGKELMGDTDLIDKERQYLGISTKPRMVPNRSRDKCLEVKRDLPPGTHNINIIGYLVDVNIFLTKKKKEKMAFIAVEDDTYMLEGAVVFPQLYKKVSHFLSVDRLIEIRGKLDNNGTLICEDILSV